MARVTAQLSVSIDGFSAGPMFTGPNQYWMDSPEALGCFRVTRWVVGATDGMRLFDPAGLGLADEEAIELTPSRVIATPRSPTSATTSRGGRR
jgi:hypothetical protein